jgi:transposase
LWQEYQALDPTTSYLYPHFCVRYQAWRKQSKLSLRQVPHAGEKLFVDYTGLTVPVIDPQTGGVRTVLGWVVLSW